MNQIKKIAKIVIYSNIFSYMKKKVLSPELLAMRNPKRKINFYFLSTGRVGTRFFSKVLNTASNAEVLHQPSPDLKETVVRYVVAKYADNRIKFKNLRVEEYAALEEKIFRQLTYPCEVYGDTLNHMFPFGYMLYKYFGPEKVRLIHLIRNPRDCGRSILKAERDDSGSGRFKELRPPEFIKGSSPAEKVANIWNSVNGMIRYQFSQINDPDVCKVIRLEDVNVDMIKDLFEFLHLEGFSKDKIIRLMNDTTHKVRHSHILINSERKDATEEELSLIEHLCEPLANKYNYMRKDILRIEKGNISKETTCAPSSPEL